LSTTGCVLVWFTRDLRLADNAALTHAVASGRSVLACYVHDERPTAALAEGAASRWWLGRSLAALAAALQAKGGRLVLRRGEPGRVLEALALESGAHEVVCSKRYEPVAAAEEGRVAAVLEARGIGLRALPGRLLFEPAAIRNRTGQPFKQFTAFWRTCLAASSPATARPAPLRIRFHGGDVGSESLGQWRLQPRGPDWARGLAETWTPGEHGALARLDGFLEAGLGGYAEARELPGVIGTSRLSAHLHFGEIGPRQVWAAVEQHARAGRGAGRGAEAFLRELGWREFSYHLLASHPELPSRPLRPEFERFPWREDAAALAAWQRGATGYPIVDAGMRELWQTGWMHNRVRMVVASFLIKHLLLPWQHGASWFWDTLVDADLANNSASWQWVAGCGADAAPYFRIFNPVRQGTRFDTDGRYVRRWVPELARLPDGALHAPWAASTGTLGRAGIVLGRDYPAPVVDHREARARALAALESTKACV
jgi:deoxyribodipyrimidine photo-lyase